MRAQKTVMTDRVIYEWSPPPDRPSLIDGEVHVWGAYLELPEERVRDLEQLLTRDESERAGRFRFRQLASRFIVGRALLRIILGRYLDIAARSVRFSYNAYGKPDLAMTDENGLRFNLSRSNDMVLYAITASAAVGIDVERISEELRVEEIAERFFSPAESAAIRALDGIEKCEAFFDCWVRKEAYLKAIGKGLSHPLSEIELSGKPVSIGGESNRGSISRWSLTAFDAATGYKAALVAEGGCKQVKYFWWKD
jgi:4'-phosphopantetheinyl transferase